MYALHLAHLLLVLETHGDTIFVLFVDSLRNNPEVMNETIVSLRAFGKAHNVVGQGRDCELERIYCESGCKFQYRDELHSPVCRELCP